MSSQATFNGILKNHCNYKTNLAHKKQTQHSRHIFGNFGSKTQLFDFSSWFFNPNCFYVSKDIICNINIFEKLTTEMCTTALF